MYVILLQYSVKYSFSSILSIIFSYFVAFFPIMRWMQDDIGHEVQCDFLRWLFQRSPGSVFTRKPPREASLAEIQRRCDERLGK